MGPVRSHVCAANIGRKDAALELELVMTRKPDSKPDPNINMLDTIHARLAIAVRELREAAQSGQATDQNAALQIADRLDRIVEDIPHKPAIKIAS